MARLPRPLARLVLLPALLTGSVLLAQSRTDLDADLLLGTWRVDLDQSRYSPGPPVRSERRIYTRDAHGIVGRIEREYADGRREVIDYRADLDREVPVSGTRAYDAIRLERIDAWTTEGVLSHAGRVFGVSRRIIEKGGRRMSISFRREEPGDMVNNFAVYTKEP